MSLGSTACLLPLNLPAFWGRDSWNSKAERGVKGREGDGDERLREGPYVWKRTSPRFFINVIRKYATAVFTSSGLGFCSSMQSLMKVPAQLQSLFFPLHVPLLIQIRTAVNITRSMFSVMIPHARLLSAQWFSGICLPSRWPIPSSQDIQNAMHTFLIQHIFSWVLPGDNGFIGNQVTPCNNQCMDP